MPLENMQVLILKDECDPTGCSGFMGMVSSDDILIRVEVWLKNLVKIQGMEVAKEYLLS